MGADWFYNNPGPPDRMGTWITMLCMMAIHSTRSLVRADCVELIGAACRTWNSKSRSRTRGDVMAGRNWTRCNIGGLVDRRQTTDDSETERLSG